VESWRLSLFELENEFCWDTFHVKKHCPDQRKFFAGNWSSKTIFDFNGIIALQKWMILIKNIRKIQIVWSVNSNMSKNDQNYGVFHQFLAKSSVLTNILFENSCWFVLIITGESNGVSKTDLRSKIRPPQAELFLERSTKNLCCSRPSSRSFEWGLSKDRKIPSKPSHQKRIHRTRKKRAINKIH
jgi:hypothetical protein